MEKDERKALEIIKLKEKSDGTSYLMKIFERKERDSSENAWRSGALQSENLNFRPLQLISFILINYRFHAWDIYLNKHKLQLA